MQSGLTKVIAPSLLMSAPGSNDSVRLVQDQMQNCHENPLYYSL